jgi:prepilin-type N-terminal cleavage/methylation domain-containing protein
MYHSKQNLLSALPKCKGFSLPEVMAALIILAFVCSSVLVVIHRSMTSAADLRQRMQAFEVARDNMEKLLAADAVKEMVEYGISYKYPDIQWQTVVETFYEPVTTRMWIQAICSGEYTDTAGETQTVELTHWLTNLTKKQILQIVEEKQKEKERLAEEGQLVGTLVEAAEYAGVDEETVEQWVENGMLVADDGGFVKDCLDLYQQYDGSPPPEAKEQVAQAFSLQDGKVIGPASGPARAPGTKGAQGSKPQGARQPSSATQGAASTAAPDNPWYGINPDTVPPELLPMLEQLLGPRPK